MSMGETKEAEKGEARGDAKTSGLTSPSKEGSTSGGEPATSTEEQVKEEVRKHVSDELTRAGRTAEDFEKREAALKQEREELEQWRKERDEAELNAAREDPDKLPLVQQRQALRKKEEELHKKEAQLEADKLSHKAEIDAARETRREIDVWEVAKDNGLDVVLLKETCGEFNAQSREQIEKVAKALAKGKAPEPPPPPPTPDSGRTSGGGQMPEKAKDKIKSGFADIHK